MKDNFESLRDRITVVDQVTHYSPRNNKTYPFESRYSIELKTVEQPYERSGLNAYVEEEWKPLDLGWIKKASLLILKNEEGKFPRNPTEKERLALIKRLIVVGFKSDENSNPLEIIVIPPQTDIRFFPKDISKIYMRSAFEKVHYSMLILPE